MTGRRQGRDEVLGRGLAGWLMRLWKRTSERRACTPQLALIERIALGPRQALALVEAEGMRVLVATSADGAAAFYPLQSAAGGGRVRGTLEASVRIAGRGVRPGTPGRVSW